MEVLSIGSAFFPHFLQDVVEQLCRPSIIEGLLRGELCRCFELFIEFELIKPYKISFWPPFLSVLLAMYAGHVLLEGRE
jgi:hypothetical protein